VDRRLQPPSLVVWSVRLKNILPRDEHVWFLIAEAARLEPSGKASLLGFFGGERIQIADYATLPSGFPLTFVFVLREGVGCFEGAFQIRDPLGELVYNEALAPVIKRSPVENHGIAINLRPFPVTAFGTYRVALILDGKRYKRSLQIDADAPSSSFMVQ